MSLARSMSKSLLVAVIQELINIGALFSRTRCRASGTRGVADMILGRALATQRAGRINDERLSEATLQLSHNFATSRPPAKTDSAAVLHDRSGYPAPRGHDGLVEYARRAGHGSPGGSSRSREPARTNVRSVLLQDHSTPVCLWDGSPDPSGQRTFAKPASSASFTIARIPVPAPTEEHAGTFQRVEVLAGQRIFDPQVISLDKTGRLAAC